MNRKPPRHTSFLHSTLGLDWSLIGHELGVFYLGMSQEEIYDNYIYSLYKYICIYYIYRVIQLWWIQQFGAAKKVRIGFQLFWRFGFLEVSSTKQFRVCATMLCTRVARIKQTYAHEFASSCNHARLGMTKPYFADRSCYGIEYLLDLRTYIQDNLTTVNQDRIKTSNTSSWTIAWISHCPSPITRHVWHHLQVI